MFPSISQNINQCRYTTFKKLEPKDYNLIGGKSAQKIDDEFDFNRKIVEQNERQIFILGGLAITVLLGSFLYNVNAAKKLFGHSSKHHMSATIRKFESLKNCADIPTIENCKSINKELKNILENQINYARASQNIISESGNPKSLNRLLLFGPAGVGKSFFAKVFAKSLDAEYKEVLYSDFNSMWAGEGVNNLKEIFEEIQKTAITHPNKKYVVSFNEIDTIVQPIERIAQAGKGTHYLSKLEERSVFLNYLEILKDKAPNVTIIGTTNLSPKNNGLDRAAMSRFQNLTEVPYPEEDCLYEALKTNLEQIKNSKQFIDANNIELKKISKHMAERKFSFRNLEFIINEAKGYHLNDMINSSKKDFSIDYIKKAEQNLKYSDGELENINK